MPVLTRPRRWWARAFATAWAVVGPAGRLHDHGRGPVRSVRDRVPEQFGGATGRHAYRCIDMRRVEWGLHGHGRLCRGHVGGADGDRILRELVTTLVGFPGSN